MDPNIEVSEMNEKEAAAKTLTAVIYALYAGGFLIGISAIVAIIINYVKKQDVAGSWLESHFRWQTRTFWFGLLWNLLALTTFFIGIGIAVFAANFIWIIYRLVKGFLNLNDNKPMYSPN